MTQERIDTKPAANRTGRKPDRTASRPGGRRKRTGAQTVRLQLHLDPQTVERLAVHCALVHRNQSTIADAVLGAWLGRYGKGRELFGPAPDGPAEAE